MEQSLLHPWNSYETSASPSANPAMTTILPTHNTSPHALDRSTALSILSSPHFSLPIGNAPVVQDKGFPPPFKQPQIFVKPSIPLNEQNKIVPPQPLGEQVMKQEINNDLNKGQLSWASDAYNQNIKKRRLSGGASPSPKPYDSKVPRPPNAFIIYHRTKSKELAAVKRSVSDDRHPSKTVAEMWREEPEHVKLRYQREADLALVEHKKKYPFYKYKPKKNKGKGKEGQNSCGSSDNKNEDEKNVDQVPIEHRKQASMESAFTVFDLAEEKKPIQLPQPRILTLQQQSAAQITSHHASQHACIPETPNTPAVISWDNVLNDSIISGQFASVHAQPEQGQLSNYAHMGTEAQIQLDSQLNGGQFPLTGDRLVGAEFTDVHGTIISEQTVIDEILKLILSQGGAYNSATLTPSATSDIVTSDVSALFPRDSASVASENSNHISSTPNIINTSAAVPTPAPMMTPPFQSLDEFKFYEDISCNPNPSSTSNPVPLSQPSLSSDLSINLPQDAWVMNMPGVVPMTTATTAATVAPPTPTTPLGFAPWSGVGGSGACSNCGGCSKIPLQTIHEGKVAQSVSDFNCGIVNMASDVMEGVVVPVQHVQHNELQTQVQTTADSCWGYIV